MWVRSKGGRGGGTRALGAVIKPRPPLGAGSAQWLTSASARRAHEAAQWRLIVRLRRVRSAAELADFEGPVNRAGVAVALMHRCCLLMDVATERLRGAEDPGPGCLTSEAV